MEITLTKLNEQDIATTNGQEIEMTISDKGKAAMFKILSKSIYSNPIGSVVREITSNCFDSHIEAGVNFPVLIKKTYDNATETTYISFIDYGVGMSPERVKNIYSVYLESTKRADNTQIGGWGVGGKSVLAYRRATGLGEYEYDNSFFVITTFNGIKYNYCIYEGNQSPIINLLNSEPTEDRNGTEIKVPVLERDVERFETEIVNQLYYFENLVFEGFSDTVTNDYKIYSGKTFLYRGSDVDSYMHICLGRVAYPINWSVLGLSSRDYQIPVAVKLNIGDVQVNISRELLDYSESTIKFLKGKVEEVKKELTEMLIKQYEDVVSLEDYYEVKNGICRLKMPNGDYLNLGDVIEKNKISFNNFPYNNIKLVREYEIFSLFFDIRLYGKKVGNSYNSNYVFQHNIKSLKEFKGLFYVNGEMKRKLVKQAYLKSIYPTRYYVMIPRNLGDEMTFKSIAGSLDISIVDPNSPTVSSGHISMTTEDAIVIVKKLRDEVFTMIKKYAVDYDTLVVPQTFIEDRKMMKLSKTELKTEFVVKCINRRSHRGRNTLSMENLMKFRGKIFYGFKDDEGALNTAHHVFVNCFNGDHVVNLSYSSKFSEPQGIAFIMVSKQNEKYVKYHRNAYHVSQFFHKMLYRKIEGIKLSVASREIIAKYQQIYTIFKDKNFNLVSKPIAKEMKAIQKEMVKFENVKRYSNLNLSNIIFTNNVKFETDKDKSITDLEKKLDKYIQLTEKNEGVLDLIKLPHYGLDITNKNINILIDMLQLMMVLK